MASDVMYQRILGSQTTSPSGIKASPLTRAQTDHKRTLTSHWKEFSKPKLLSQINDDLQAKDVSLKAANEYALSLEHQLYELLEEREKLTCKISELQDNLHLTSSRLKFAQDCNEVLTRSLYESDQKVQALHKILGEKENKVKQLKNGLELSASEAEFMRQSRSYANDLIEKNFKEAMILKHEAANSKWKSSYDRQEADILLQNLNEASIKIEHLTKDLESAKRCASCLEDANLHLADEIASLKAIIVTKEKELRDALLELEFFRSANKNVSDIFEHARLFRTKRLNFAMDNISDFDNNFTPPLSANTRRSSLNQNLFFMLQSQEQEVAEWKEDSQSPRTLSPHTLIKSESSASSLPEINKTPGAKKFKRMDILTIYPYLTAAAVKYRYPDIDISCKELVSLGENVPFWDLFPFFSNILEKSKTKKKHKSSAGIILRLCSKSERKQTNEYTSGWTYYF